MLTKVTFICDDSKLGKACRALVGIATEQPQVQPMANAMAVKSQVANVRTMGGTTLRDSLKEMIIQENLERISASTMKQMTIALGYAPLSVYKTLQDLVADKFLKRTSMGQYEVRKT